MRKNFPSFLAPWGISIEESVGAVVLQIKDNTPLYLLLHYHNGHWDFPKGHIEEGESHEETLRREIEEETGITSVSIDPTFKLAYVYWYLAKNDERTKRISSKRGLLVRKKVTFYIAQTSQESISLSHEHKDFSWLPFQKAHDLLTYQNAKNLLMKANNHCIKTID